jgi:hypothetical protein
MNMKSLVYKHYCHLCIMENITESLKDSTSQKKVTNLFVKYIQ